MATVHEFRGDWRNRAVRTPDAARGWTAILLAGERPGGDPLAAHFQVPGKALIRIAGVSMLRRVANALLAAPEIGRVVVLAQDPDALMVGDAEALAADPRISLAQSGPGIASSIAAIAGSEVAPWPVVVTTADHALLTPAMVREFLAGVGDRDLAVGVGERATIEARYPTTRRTWLKFSDGQYSGANLFALRNGRVSAALNLWAGVERERKKAWKLIARFGPALFIRALTRTISFATAMERAGARLGIVAAPVVLSAPEAAIDVDKLADFELVEAILSGRAAAPSTAGPPRAVSSSSPKLIAVYDLDRTVTFRPTYSLFLLHAAWVVAPARLLLAPLAALAMLAHGLGLFSRDRLKSLMWAMMLGRAKPVPLGRAVESFVRRTLGGNIRPGARAQIARDRESGALLVLATAAHELYAGPIAAALGFDAVVATQAVVHADGRIGPELVGANVYGDGKLAALLGFLESRAVRRADATVIFYSDSSSDRPVFERVDRPVGVNPSGRLARLAARRGWPVMDWGRP